MTYAIFMPVAEHGEAAAIAERSGEHYLLVRNCFRYN